MPVKSENIQWDEIGKAAPSTLLPLGLTGLAWYIFAQKPDQSSWFKRLKKPNWVLDDEQTVAVIDLATIAPIGYAAHMICKEVVAKADDRKLALTLYGAGLASFALAIPIYTQTKDTSYWFGAALLSSGLFGATAYAFYKINPTAGYLLAPFVAWGAYGTISMFAIMQQNPKAGTDLTPK